MKILHVSPSYYPAFKFGGPIVSVHMLNKKLVSKGIQLVILTTHAASGVAAFVEGKYVGVECLLLV